MRLASGNERRTHCVVCASDRLGAITVTPPVPVYQGCVAEDAGGDISEPMRWEVCEACASAQLANALPLELVYQGAHATGLGSAWDLHHKAFAAFVAKHRRGEVLEVGGGGGKLARFFRAVEREPRWHILEPNPTLIGEAIPRVSLVRGFLDENFSVPDQVETLVFCHCLEHIYNIGEIVAVMAAKLPPDGRVILAWPDLESWIVRGEPGAINWEHTFFCAVETLTDLFAKNGFRLAESQTFGKDHSVFLAFAKSEAPQTQTQAKRDFEAVRARIGEYFAKFARKAAALNAMARARTRPVYAAPASIYTQYLFAFGLDPKLVAGLVDNSPLKQGRRLYGTPLRVLPSATLEGKDSTVILNGGAHNSEMAAEFKRVNPQTEILFAAEIP
jgi:SAM-dependent methyltransferase